MFSSSGSIILDRRAARGEITQGGGKFPATISKFRSSRQGKWQRQTAMIRCMALHWKWFLHNW